MSNFMTDKQQIIEEIEARLLTFELSEVEKITGVPLGLYQRFFSYMYGISLSAYLRKRRLTYSASQLLCGEWSVTTASQACGYEEASSFSRAFKEQFQVSPSAITMKDFKEHRYEVLQLNDNSKAKLVLIEYPIIREQYLIGIDTGQYPQTVGNELWRIFGEENIGAKLAELEENLIGQRNNQYVAIGYMSDFPDSSSLGKEYMVGRLFSELPSQIEGLKIKRLPAMQLVHAKIKGKNLDDILEGAYALTCDSAFKNGYEIDYQSFFWLEYHSSEFFWLTSSDQEGLVLDFYLPCKKQGTSFGGIQ